MSLKDRYQNEINGFVRVTYKDMVCRDCKFAYTKPQEVLFCKEYPDIKPSKVLSGKNCTKYEK